MLLSLPAWAALVPSRLTNAILAGTGAAVPSFTALVILSDAQSLSSPKSAYQSLPIRPDTQPAAYADSVSRSTPTPCAKLEFGAPSGLGRGSCQPDIDLLGAGDEQSDSRSHNSAKNGCEYDRQTFHRFGSSLLKKCNQLSHLFGGKRGPILN